MSNGERIMIVREMDIQRAVMLATRLARQGGFSAVGVGQIATSVSELARNIFKYAGTGRVTLTALAGGRGIEVCAEDHGPGIPDTDKAFEERFSTGGTLGLGLPGVRRMMDEVEIESAEGRGTRVTARKLL